MKTGERAETPKKGNNPIREKMIELMGTQKGESSFERYLREQPIIAISPSFIDGNGKVRPAHFTETGKTMETADSEKIASLFPRTMAAHGNKLLGIAPGASLKVGPVAPKRVLVLFSGGPAAGGNNVIVGLYTALGSGNKLLGVKAGPGGLLKGNTFEITDNDIRGIANMGGFDFLGSDRTKIEEIGQFEKVKNVCRDQKIDAIVVIGGDDSNTNAAFLAEALFEGIHPDGRGVQVIGIPKTIDGDLQVPDLLDISFGFDTATRIYSELAGNIAQDTPSSRKYWHFIRIMGRAASHVALEVALQVRPAIALISEEVAAKKNSIGAIIESICTVIAYRAARGINHGVVIVPEGLIEFIPEMQKLIGELNRIIAAGRDELKGMDTAGMKEHIRGHLSGDTRATLDSLPDDFKSMLLLDRDEHGNLPLSQIETQKLLIQMCAKKLKEIQANPAAFKFPADLSEEEIAALKKFKFATIEHFLGYEGRCGTPSKFDLSYSTNLGLVAGSLILQGKTGYMAALTGLDSGGTPLAVPLTGLLNIEKRGGKEKVVIKKALVDLDAPAFKTLEHFRAIWARDDYFHSIGPRQYAGPHEITDRMPVTVMLNRGYDSTRFNLGKELSIHEFF